MKEQADLYRECNPPKSKTIRGINILTSKADLTKGNNLLADGEMLIDRGILASFLDFCVGLGFLCKAEIRGYNLIAKQTKKLGGCEALVTFAANELVWYGNPRLYLKYSIFGGSNE